MRERRPDWRSSDRVRGGELAVVVLDRRERATSPTALVMMPTVAAVVLDPVVVSPETASDVLNESRPVGLKSRLTRPPTRR